MFFLIGEENLNKWKNNKKYFTNIEEKIGKKFYKNICIVALNEYVKIKSGANKEVEKLLVEFSDKLANMNDKKAYLENIDKAKKKNEAEIKKIDNLLNNLNDLKQEFIKSNNELEEDKKIFSLSDFVELKQNTRKKLIEEIKYYSESMKPNVFVEKKENIKQYVEILESSMNEEVKDKCIINLQKETLKNFIEKINKIETKKEIYDIIYKLRYYKEIFINEDKKVKEIKELRTLIRKAEKSILTVACNFKVLNILSNSVEENYKIMEEIFDNNMIDLEDIILEFKKKNDKVILYIYEDEILSKTKEYDKFEDLNVKFNKKFKLFI